MSAITMTPTNLDQTREQRMLALDRANVVRGRRAELKIALKNGDESALTILDDPPAYAHTMKVIDVLLALPAVGRVKAGKWMWRAEASPSKTLAGLSPRQRAALCATVRVWERR